MQCGQPDGGLDSFGKLEHLLLLRIDRCVLVWPKVASLSDRTEVRIAQAHANPSKLAILVEVSRLVSESVIFGSHLQRPIDFLVDIVAVVEELTSGLIHEDAEVDVRQQRDRCRRGRQGDNSKSLPAHFEARCYAS